MDRDITDRLTEVGGFDPVAELCSEARDEIFKLRAEKKDIEDKMFRVGTILRHLTPEKYPDVLFIHAHLGEKDQNGMPEKLLIVPAYGCDFSYVYERTDKITGPEW